MATRTLPSRRRHCPLGGHQTQGTWAMFAAHCTHAHRTCECTHTPKQQKDAGALARLNAYSQQASVEIQQANAQISEVFFWSGCDAFGGCFGHAAATTSALDLVAAAPQCPVVVGDEWQPRLARRCLSRNLEPTLLSRRVALALCSFRRGQARRLGTFVPAAPHSQRARVLVGCCSRWCVRRSFGFATAGFVASCSVK